MIRYLFISSHCDDAMLSCGGTMLKLAEESHLVSHLSISNCNNWDLVEEFTMSNKTLGVPGYCHQFRVRKFHEERSDITKLLYACIPNYDFIITHSSIDRHTDHKTVAEESLRVFNCSMITYVGPWNGLEESNYFIELSEEHLEKKIAALSCYKSQSHRPYMNPDFIRSQAIYNGIKCGKRYAEAFRIEKLIN